MRNRYLSEIALGLVALVALAGLSCQLFDTKMEGSQNEQPWSPSNAVEKLGYQLYFEKALSADNSISCNSCHNILNKGNGAESSNVSTGFLGRKGDRNSPTVWNAQFLSVQFWDGRARDLAEQAKGPMINPDEMALKDHTVAIKKIENIKGYKQLYADAFPGNKNPITIDNTASAIAAFESKLVSLKSNFDKGELSELEKKGQETFQNVGCASCHSGTHFAGPQLPIGTGFYMKFPNFSDKSLEQKYQFSKDTGRHKVTGLTQDKNMWRVPSLRNVAETAPFFHNGSVTDLQTAIRVMAKTQLNRDLEQHQVVAIEAFLQSLTGQHPLIVEPKAL